MFFSKTTTYALRILILMSLENQESYPAAYLYDKLKIPKQYLRRLLTELTRSGFIVSSRGRNGGFVFAKNPDNIFISQIIDAVEGLDSLNTCFLGVRNCDLAVKCAMHDLWAGVKDSMNTILSGTTLKDIRDKNLSST
jgi:Rrf2 family protein